METEIDKWVKSQNYETLHTLTKIENIEEGNDDDQSITGF